MPCKTRKRRTRRNNGEYWIQGAIRREGALRQRMRELGFIKSDEKIPVSALKRAAAGEFGPQTARRARLALTLRKLR